MGGESPFGYPFLQQRKHTVNTCWKHREGNLEKVLPYLCPSHVKACKVLLEFVSLSPPPPPSFEVLQPYSTIQWEIERGPRTYPNKWQDANVLLRLHQILKTNKQIKKKKHPKHPTAEVPSGLFLSPNTQPPACNPRIIFSHMCWPHITHK